MKLPLSGGEWLFINGFIYLIVGLVDVVWYNSTYIVVIQLVWLLMLWLPLIVPMEKIINVISIWRNK
jgi:hypothetical protein